MDRQRLFSLTREQAQNFYAKVWEDAEKRGDWSAVAELGREDRFFLLTWLLNRPDANRDWIYARCREVERDPDGYLDLWAREHYKLQRLDEPTPTPDGWKIHGDLLPGDEIFGPDGNVCRVIALNAIVTDADCYEIEFDDGFKITAGGEHLWPVERRTKKRVPGTFSKDGIGKRHYRETVLVKTEEIARHAHLPDRRLAVRVNDPLDLPAADLPVDPYVLGLWLGDGTSANGGITCGDAEIFKNIEALGYTLGPDKTPLRNAEYRHVDGLSDSLKALGLCGVGCKSIPAIYLRASKEQRIALLQGMMDTDGHCNTRGTATFVNTNGDLVDGFVELCHTLGLKPRRRRHLSEYNGEPYPYWQVSFQAYKALPPFRLGRKLDRCKDGARPNPRRYIVACRAVDPVPMRCIQVDREDGLYLTGRSMVPTHNSTVITFAGTIQEVIRDPEITIGIFSFSNKDAAKFFHQIKYELEENGRLKACYPHILWEKPEREAKRWSQERGLVVKRKGNPKEATVASHGLIDGLPTGNHYRLLLFDDVITEREVTTPEMIEKATQQWQQAQNLGTEGGRRWHVGTRYHFSDTYGIILKQGSVKERVYSATVDGKPTGGPVLVSTDYLEQKRRDLGPYVFACQWLLNPVADEAQGFKSEWLKHYDSNIRGTNNYILVDPASEKKKTSDYTAMFVIGLGRDRNYYVLDMVRDRLNLTERTDRLFELHAKWQPLAVGYEKYGKDSDIQHIEDRMQRENYRFSITPLGGQTKKEDRIRRLIPLFEQGRVWFPEVLYRNDYEGRRHDLVRDFIEEEYLGFPVAVHDDLMDCLARILDPEMPARWPKGEINPDTGKPDRYRRNERKRKRSWMAA